MAANIFRRDTVTGAEWHTRKGSQGAPTKPDEIKNTYTVIIHMTEQEYNKFMEAKGYLKASAFGRIILFLGLESYLNQTIG
jgi:hypothetical protein